MIVLSEASLREMRVSKPEKVVYRALKCAYPCVLNSDEAETLFAAFVESGSNKKNAKKQLRVVTMYQYNRMPVLFFSPLVSPLVCSGVPADGIVMFIINQPTFSDPSLKHISLTQFHCTSHCQKHL